MNKKIYVFWYGDSNKKEELTRYYDEINRIIHPWKIELGPSEEEHQYLLRNYKYYSLCFYKKIYAFCSDVWRIYKIHKEGGLYLDSGCKFNEKKILLFLKQIEKFRYLFVLERPYYLWNGMFWFKEKNDKSLERILNKYKQIRKINFNHTITGPIYFSHYIFNCLGTSLEKNRDMLVIKSNQISKYNKNNIIYMNPSSSWWKYINNSIDRKYTCDEGWLSSYNSFNNDNEKYWLILLKRKLYSSIILNWLITYKFIYLMVIKLL